MHQILKNALHSFKQFIYFFEDTFCPIEEAHRIGTVKKSNFYEHQAFCFPDRGFSIF